ncbi:hypothetical protein M433DRAFT_10052 [Acidomyces richmondensis BFW]|nr:MAG: hypothetical protein FE78DRAFT_34756 [Acidomyces sp. 'richmondensis']KYG39744.1 hypothetical protein M433DRAFT_10052 [Acidomyces richmondensis BFW]
MTNSQGEEVTTYKGKADILAAHFFLEPKPADLSDLLRARYPDPFPDPKHLPKSMQIHPSSDPSQTLYSMPLETTPPKPL